MMLLGLKNASAYDWIMLNQDKRSCVFYKQREICVVSEDLSLLFVNMPSSEKGEERISTWQSPWLDLLQARFDLGVSRVSWKVAAIPKTHDSVSCYNKENGGKLSWDPYLEDHLS